MTLLDQGRAAQRFSRIEELREILLDRPDKTVTLRDLANRHGFDQSEVRRLASEFPDELKIHKKAAGDKGGRPSEMVSIPEPQMAGFAGKAGIVTFPGG